MIDTRTLQACGIAVAQAKVFAGPLAGAAARFGITTRERIAAFLAQAAHESGNFTRTSENLNYTTPQRICDVFPAAVPTIALARTLAGQPEKLANRVYAKRLGNGDEDSGDGWRYRGRGLFQLTGATNYKRAEIGLGISYSSQPDLVALPVDAAMTAAWFWSTISGNALAEKGDIDGITRRINGSAMLGAAERRDAFQRNLRVLP